MIGKRSFVGDTLASTAARTIAVACMVLSQIMLARGLGADGRGVVAGIVVYPMLLVTLFEGGIRQASAHMIGSRRLPDGEVAGAAIVCHLVLSFGGSAVCLAVLTLAGKVAADWTLAALGVALIPLHLAVTYAGGILLGKGALDQFNRTTLSHQLAYLAIVLVLLMLDQLTVRLALWAAVLSLLIGAIQAVYLAGHWLRTEIRVRWDALTAVIQRGAMYALALFLITLNYRVGIVVLDFVSNEAELGRYVVASQLTELLWQVPTAIGMVVLTRSATADHRPFDARAVARVVRVTVAISSVAAFCLGVGAFLFMSLVFGPDFAQATHMVAMLLPGAILAAAFKIVNVYLAGRGRPEVSLLAILPAIALNCLLCLLLVPRFGGVGASAAASISYASAGIIIGRVFIAESRITWKELLVWTVADRTEIAHLVAQAVRKAWAKLH